MRNYKTVQIEEEEITDIVCDKCGKVITPNDMTEWQETIRIEFVGGYGSVFGDENYVTCDLCQKCLDELIGKFCYINGEKQKC